MSSSTVTLDGDRVLISGFEIRDPGLVELLRGQPADRRQQVVERALSVGARGLLTMGLGIDLTEVDRRVRRSVEEVTAEARRQVEQVLEVARVSLDQRFDPDQRNSLVAKAMTEFTDWRDGFLSRMDPECADSHTARLLEGLQAMLGPGGALDARLSEALDPGADGSALARLAAVVDHRLLELRDILQQRQGREQEAELGTRKGFDFEDVVEANLREAARELGGATVERTSRTAGELAGDALVGDFVVTLRQGTRVVVEAKNVRSISLTGDGILAELDRAMANRRAQAAVCVSAQEAFPREVGPFGVYGNRVLVVDDGEGTLSSVALRWLEATLAAGAEPDQAVLDAALVADRLQRIRSLGQGFSTNRRTLTEISGSVGKVQASLDELRSTLLGLVDDLAAELQRASRDGGAEVVDLHRQVG